MISNRCLCALAMLMPVLTHAEDVQISHPLPLSPTIEAYMKVPGRFYMPEFKEVILLRSGRGMIAIVEGRSSGSWMMCYVAEFSVPKVNRHLVPKLVDSRQFVKNGAGQSCVFSRTPLEKEAAIKICNALHGFILKTRYPVGLLPPRLYDSGYIAESQVEHFGRFGMIVREEANSGYVLTSVAKAASDLCEILFDNMRGLQILDVNFDSVVQSSIAEILERDIPAAIKRH